MTTQARNERPLHVHTAEEDAERPWTQDTLSAHLRSLHGVDQIPDDAPLAELVRKHDELNHDPASPAKDPILAAALAPERRYASITLGVPRMGYPGDSALHFEDLNGNGTNIVNLRPGDLPVLRAAVTPEDPDLAVIRAKASAALGPGAHTYVLQSHHAGYRLGVRDMEAVSAGMTEAERVSDWLDGLYESVTSPGQALDTDPGIAQAISVVRDLITRRMEDGRG